MVPREGGGGVVVGPSSVDTTLPTSSGSMFTALATVGGVVVVAIRIAGFLRQGETCRVDRERASELYPLIGKTREASTVWTPAVVY